MQRRGEGNSRPAKMKQVRWDIAVGKERPSSRSLPPKLRTVCKAAHMHRLLPPNPCPLDDAPIHRPLLNKGARLRLPNAHSTLQGHTQRS